MKIPSSLLLASEYTNSKKAAKITFFNDIEFSSVNKVSYCFLFKKRSTWQTCKTTKLMTSIWNLDSLSQKFSVEMEEHVKLPGKPSFCGFNAWRVITIWLFIRCLKTFLPFVLFMWRIIMLWIFNFKLDSSYCKTTSLSNRKCKKYNVMLLNNIDTMLVLLQLSTFRLQPTFVLRLQKFTISTIPLRGGMPSVLFSPVYLTSRWNQWSLVRQTQR